MEHLEIEGVLEVDDVFPSEGRVVKKVLPVFWFDVELLYSLRMAQALCKSLVCQRHQYSSLL